MPAVIGGEAWHASVRLSSIWIEMHTRTEFRLLVLFNALLIPVAMFVSRHDPRLLPPELQAWLASTSLVSAGMLQSVAAVVSMVAFMALCVGLLGMLAFQRWARGLTLWATVLIYIPTPMSGPFLLSGFGYVMDSAAAILWGALLAAAYWAPVAAGFERRPRPAAPIGPAAIPIPIPIPIPTPTPTSAATSTSASACAPASAAAAAATASVAVEDQAAPQR